MKRDGAQRFPFDEGHHVVEQVTRGAGGEQRHHVRVLEAGREQDLPLEPVHAHAGRHLRWEHLDDDLPAESGLLGEEDVAHPAPAELALDAVGVA